MRNSAQHCKASYETAYQATRRGKTARRRARHAQPHRQGTQHHQHLEYQICAAGSSISVFIAQYHLKTCACIGKAMGGSAAQCFKWRKSKGVLQSRSRTICFPASAPSLAFMMRLCAGRTLGGKAAMRAPKILYQSLNETDFTSRQNNLAGLEHRVFAHYNAVLV